LFSLFKLVVVVKPDSFLWKTPFSSFFSSTCGVLKGVGNTVFGWFSKLDNFWNGSFIVDNCEDIQKASTGLLFSKN
jgi:hypothetical protein